METQYIVLSVVGWIVVLALAWLIGSKQSQRAGAKLREASRILEDAQKEIDGLKKEALLEAKDEAHRLRTEIDRENRERRSEIQRAERRIAQKEENLERKLDGAEKRERALNGREKDLDRMRQEIVEVKERELAELARISGVTPQEAKALLLEQVENEVRHEAAKLAREIEEAAREEAENKARDILAMAIQRCAVDQAAETTVSVVPLPSDEMKGRIIGREGRNIRAFEAETGVDLIIDDTPEAVVLSAFDPVRREIARTTLSYLINDGRIHPGRIEETVARARKEVEKKIEEAAEQAVLETGVTGLPKDVMRQLGKLKFRTSYGQNVLDHSIEVAHLCGVMAGELHASVAVAKRAGLLHDIGKSVDFEVEGTHAAIGADLARHHKENDEVIHAISAHHAEEPFRTVEAVLVQAGDAVSASRPGARKETLETYIKRLENLEKIAESCAGVDKCFAIQAGREVRIIVKPEDVDDLAAGRLAKEIVHNIEEGLDYPGQIKVTVIRETRAVEYAK
ncbi:MAG: ribonuclease Y [Armatimonadota bacterium]|nr:MAG: ribonuclease Y [Armatimonadota bacterium]